MGELGFLMPAFIIIGIIGIGLIVLWVYSSVAGHKHLEEIKEKHGLVENGIYEVQQNGGKTFRELKFISIYYGNESKNGAINLLFHKLKNYRGQIIYENFVIKYGSIWKINKIGQIQEEK